MSQSPQAGRIIANSTKTIVKKVSPHIPAA